MTVENQVFWGNGPQWSGQQYQKYTAETIVFQKITFITIIIYCFHDYLGQQRRE